VPTASGPAAPSGHGPASHGALPWWRGRLARPAAFLAGAPLLLAFSPIRLHLTAVLAMAALLLLWRGCRPAEAALRGFLFGFAGFLAGTYWLYISLHQFGGAPLFVAVPLMLGLVVVMAGYFALAGWLLVRLFPDDGPLRTLLGAPGLWVLVEWTRSWFATGFPWFSWGYSQTDTALSGYAPVFGVFGVSLAVVWSAGALLTLLSGTAARRVVAVLILAALWAGGAGLRAVEWSAPAGEPLDVAVVQGGISQDLKWRLDQLPKTKALYRELTDGHWDADLVIWPEAAIPDLLDNYRDYLSDLFARAQETETDVLLGTLQAKGRRPERRYYNSVIAFDGESLREYHKRHLVPFGEYYPVPAFVRRWMKGLNLPYTDISAGGGAAEPLRLGSLPIGVSICYEDVFGAELTEVLPGAALLVNVSNDAWFGGSVAPHQHLQIARMRAIEASRPMVRATNSGISAFIDHDGAVTEASALFEARVLRASVQPRSGATPYGQFGDVPVLALAVVMLAGGRLARRRR
jgi:apolipoprotein N-acyltransferase